MSLPESIAAQLDPAYAAWLVASNPPLPEGFQPTLEQMREGFARQTNASADAADPQVQIEDGAINGRGSHTIAIRHYRPRDISAQSACCVYVHGGGWVLGDLDTHQGICLDIARQNACSVIAIDYRRSPEHHFPAAIEDIVDVLNHLELNAASLAIDPLRISLCGDSAGGSLALSSCLQLRGSSAMPCSLALIYPAVGADIDRPSFIENRDVPGLSPELMRFFFMSYIGGDTLPDELAAPLLMEDLSGLPPVFISGAQFDPLRDDSSDLAARLQDSGVDTELRIEPGLGHGYLWVRHDSRPAAEAFTAAVRFLAQDRH